MGDDIVVRLRLHWDCIIDDQQCLECDAADEIERLRARNLSLQRQLLDREMDR